MDPLKDEHETDFSLVLGGPLYQLLRRAHLEGNTTAQLVRRLLVITSLAWVPLLIITLVEGTAWGDKVTLPFLRDAEVHIRLLVSLPLLIVAELVVHRRMRHLVQTFLRRGLVPDSARAEFNAAIDRAIWLRNSIPAEIALISIVYGVGVVFLWRTTVALEVPTWYGVGVDGTLQPSLAGWWMGVVSLPFFQFLLLRWYFRLFIWARFLWHVSRIGLKLEPLHPDHCGGLGFLSHVAYAFAPVLVSQGAMLAGLAANQIFYAGATLPDFKVEIVGLVIIMVFTVLGPLLAFTPVIAAAKRSGMHAMGQFSHEYARDFSTKWLSGSRPAEPLLGSADLQSMADLANSFEIVEGMRLAPFKMETVFQLAIVTLLPLAPLGLTMISVDEFISRMVEAVF